MAYDRAGLYLVQEAGGRRAQKWCYEGIDTAATVCEAGFISDAYSRGMKVGDEVLIKQFASAALLTLTQPVKTVVFSISENAGAMLKRIWDEPGDAITASTTLTRALIGKILPVNSASQVVLTVPPDATIGGVSGGEMFCAYMDGTGQLSWAATLPAVIHTPSGLNAATQYALIGLWHTPVANVWLAVGNLTI